MHLDLVHIIFALVGWLSLPIMVLQLVRVGMATDKTEWMLVLGCLNSILLVLSPFM